MTKKLKDKDLDAILTAYAKKEADKFGTDEEVFADLREHFAKEKQAKKQSGKKTLLTWLAGATAFLFVAVIALMLILQSDTPQMFYIEDLTKQTVTEVELKAALGNDVFLLNAADYPDFTLTSCTLYRDGNEIVAYSVKYDKLNESLASVASINIIIILKENYLSSLDRSSGFNKTIESYKDTEVTKYYKESTARTIMNFLHNDRLVYLDFANIDSVTIYSILDLIIT